MIRVITILIALLLPGCVTVPGSDSPALVRYTLRAPAQVCVAQDRTLSLTVGKVAAGLDSDRIARLSVASGKMTYLQGVRWIESAGPMLEQRLAADLECRGFAVQTGHRVRAGQDQLQCEVRALNLLDLEAGAEADVALSCLYQEGGGGTEQALLQSARVPLSQWSGAAAIQALSAAYAKVFDGIIAGIATAQRG